MSLCLYCSVISLLRKSPRGGWKWERTGHSHGFASSLCSVGSILSLSQRGVKTQLASEVATLVERVILSLPPRLSKKEPVDNTSGISWSQVTVPEPITVTIH